MTASSTVTVNVAANTDRVVAVARIIAKHLTALADELELANRELTATTPEDDGE